MKAKGIDVQLEAEKWPRIFSRLEGPSTHVLVFAPVKFESGERSMCVDLLTGETWYTPEGPQLEPRPAGYRVELINE